MRGIPLLVAALSLAVALPARAGERGCGGQEPAQLAREHCGLLALRPLDGDPAAAKAHAACVDYYVAALEGVDALCEYRDTALAVDSTQALHREWVAKLGSKNTAMLRPLKVYQDALDALIERGKQVRLAELTCKLSGATAPSIDLLVAGTLSFDQSMVSWNRVSGRLSLWQTHSNRVLATQMPGALLKGNAEVAARVFSASPQSVVETPDVSERELPPAARQAGQGAAILAGKRLGLQAMSVGLLGAGFNLTARYAIKGTLDPADIWSVLTPAAIGLIVGASTKSKEVGTLSALLTGAAADFVERHARSQDLAVQVMQAYPPFALEFLKKNPESTSDELARAFHAAQKTGLCR